MTINVLTKIQAAIEDFLLGEGTTIQTRGDADYTVTKIGAASLPYDDTLVDSIKDKIDENTMAIAASLILFADDKTDALTKEPIAGQTMYIRSNDGKGHVWQAVTGLTAAVSDSVLHCGTRIVDTGWGGTKAWDRDYESAINLVWYGGIADWNGSSGTDIATSVLEMVTHAKTIDSPHLVIPKGDHYTASNLTFDLILNATIDFIGTIWTDLVGSPAVRLGSASTNTKNMRAIGVKVRRNAIDTSGGSVGVQLRSLVSSYVDIRDCRNFQDGVYCFGDSSNGGFSYNEVHLGFIRDNQRNLRLGAASPGYCNENNFYGGTYNHSSGYPAVVTTNLKLDDYPISRLNNNRFYGPSFEDNSLLAVAAIINGDNNIIFAPRLERSVSQSTYLIEFAANSGECDVLCRGFSVADSNISDLGSNNSYDTRHGEHKSTQTSAAAASIPTASDQACHRVHSSASSAAVGYMTTDTAGNPQCTLDNQGRTYTKDRGYFTNGIRWSTSDATLNDRGMFPTSGTPEGSVVASPPSMAFNIAAVSGEYLMYSKKTGSGNTGWEGLGTALP